MPRKSSSNVNFNPMVTFVTRIPLSHDAALRQRAHDEGTPINVQVVRALTAYLKDQPPIPGMPPVLVQPTPAKRDPGAPAAGTGTRDTDTVIEPPPGQPIPFQI